jgi:Ras-related protein Rab-28
MAMTGRALKLVLLGDGSSGKTSIVSRYAQDHFDNDYRQTVGVDFFSKSLELPGNKGFRARVSKEAPCSG